MAAAYRCVYLNYNTALLKLQGYQHITPSLFPDRCTTNKMYKAKTIPDILHQNTPSPIKKITEGLICQEVGEGGVPALPLAHTGGSFSARCTGGCRGAREGARDSSLLGCQEPAVAASPSSQTELS